VLNLRLPLAQLGQAAQADSPSAAIEPAAAAGLADLAPEEPTCPVALRHPLIRDAIYAGITPTRRREFGRDRHDRQPDDGAAGAPLTLGLQSYAHLVLAQYLVGRWDDALLVCEQASDLCRAMRAAPFLTRAEQELAACHLPADRAAKQTVLALTSREMEVAHLVGKGLSNPEIATELFISRKAVEYHLGNIYAKCGLQGRQQLRRFVEPWRQPAAI